MRLAAISAFALAISATAPAVAAPTLQCNYADTKTTVIIVSDAAKNVQCSYTCNFVTESGSYSATGSTTVKAGETKTVDEDTHRSKVTGVKTNTLDCK